MTDISTVIVGATGYTGSELTRLLLAHPNAKVERIVSQGRAGEKVHSAIPHLPMLGDMVFSDSLGDLQDIDLVFFATPNGIAMTQAAEIVAAGTKIIDLAADFRLPDKQQWEHWYAMKHQCPQLLSQAVYGLPECWRKDIQQANLVANPGCYPTSIILGFKPLIEAGLIDTDCLIADSKSGTSGAGRSADVSLAYSECNENFRAYKATAHRHFPEIKTQLDILAGKDIELSFTPHLLPLTRGIYSTLYAKTQASADALQACFEEAYAPEPFVQVLPQGECPEIRHVRGSNHCLIAVHKQESSSFVKVLVAIDNLIKGAAGQALQNMNLMFSLKETTGLNGVPILP